MKLSGDHVFDAPRDQVWEALLDPQVLVDVLPGCERLEEVGDNEFQGTLNIQVGPVSGRFDGNVQLTDLEPGEGYRMKISGKGAPGFVDGSGRIRLEDADGGGTRLGYEMDVQVGGRIAGVGQRLLTSSGRVIARQALEGLEARLEGDVEPAEPPEPVARETAPSPPDRPETTEPGRPESPRPKVSRPSSKAPSQAEFAVRFARGLFEEYVPPAQRPWAILGGLAWLLLCAFWLGRVSKS